MINNAPAEFTITSLIPGYTKVFVSHNVPKDFDLAGVAEYSVVGGVPQPVKKFPVQEGLSFIIMENVAADTVSEFAFYDDLVDTPELLDIAFGLNKSAPTPIELSVPPEITEVIVSAETVEVGVIPGEFTVKMSGFATTVRIQIKKTEDSVWIDKYSGPFSEAINLGTVGDGSYNVRCIGEVELPNGFKEQDTQWREFSEVVNTASASSAPQGVSNILYTAMKLTDPTESYDLKVDWDWERGSGGGVKAFNVRYKPNGSGLWSEITSVGTSVILKSVMYDTLYDLEIVSTPYGDTTATTITSQFKVHDQAGSRVPASMVFGDLTADTDIQIGYRYIRTFSTVEGTRAITFEVDAETGSMAIGRARPEYGGIAPITINGDTGVMAINGRVVSDIINAAVFELNWIDGLGTQPQFRTANKLSYSDNSDGIWFGYTAQDQFQMAIGNGENYFKYSSVDGKIRMSANVIIEGNGNLGSYYETRYLAAAPSPTPATPQADTRNPVGWSITPPTPAEGEVVWQTIGRINADETMNTGWTTPEQAVLGADGKSAYDIWLEQPGNEGKTLEEYLQSLQGSSGPGFFRWGVGSLNGWSASGAAAAMTALRGASDGQLVGDVLTLYQTDDPANAETRMWSGTSWDTASLLIHGDMIATGTIRSDKIIADNATFSEAGIDVIYNTGGDATNYTMKIDLANGEIHIK